MGELIDRDELKKRLMYMTRLRTNSEIGEPTCGLTRRTVFHMSEIMKTVIDLPTIEERKTGKWTLGCDMPPMKNRNGKPKKFWPSLRYCSVCGHEAYDDSDWGETLFDWCPYCGADMRGDADG